MCIIKNSYNTLNHYIINLKAITTKAGAFRQVLLYHKKRYDLEAYLLSET